jgi:predicted RNase H-like nuclease (RuvC/YqgF family)
MDRTTEVEALKKIVFNLQFKMAMNQSDSEEMLDISRKAQETQRKIDALVSEIEESNGQVGFAFSELIDVSKLKKEKGKK